VKPIGSIKGTASSPTSFTCLSPERPTRSNTRRPPRTASPIATSSPPLQLPQRSHSEPERIAAPGTFCNVRARPAGFLNSFLPDGPSVTSAKGRRILPPRPATSFPHVRQRSAALPRPPRTRCGRRVRSGRCPACNVGRLIFHRECARPWSFQLPQLTSASSLLDQRAGCGYSTAS